MGTKAPEEAWKEDASDTVVLLNVSKTSIPVSEPTVLPKKLRSLESAWSLQDVALSTLLCLRKEEGLHWQDRSALGSAWVWSSSTCGPCYVAWNVCLPPSLLSRTRPMTVVCPYPSGTTLAKRSSDLNRAWALPRGWNWLGILQDTLLTFSLFPLADSTVTDDSYFLWISFFEEPMPFGAETGISCSAGSLLFLCPSQTGSFPSCGRSPFLYSFLDCLLVTGCWMPHFLLMGLNWHPRSFLGSET